MMMFQKVCVLGFTGSAVALTSDSLRATLKRERENPPIPSDRPERSKMPTDVNPKACRNLLFTSAVAPGVDRTIL